MGRTQLRATGGRGGTGTIRLGQPRRNYWTLSTRPLHILCFLLPLILIYEVGSAVLFAGTTPAQHETVLAYRMIYDTFAVFGVGGLYLPGFLVVAVLLLWHLFTRDSWQVNAGVLAGMFVESVLWTLPLLVVGQIANRIIHGHPDASAIALAGVADVGSLPRSARAVLAIGAGVYEELIFRMILIAAAHLVLVDLLGVRELPGRALAILAAAVAFAFYHDIRAPDGSIDGWQFSFYLGAGVFFGAIYAWRGFGIVVAAHALYDLAVLVLLRPGSG